MPIHPTRRHMIALTGAALWAGPARAEKPATRTIEGRAFASHWRITAPASMEPHRAAIEALLARIDQQMSPWRDDSDITRFNTRPSEAPVSQDTAQVARAALKIARISGGWFDPTVGPLVAKWGFGRIAGTDAGHWQGLTAGDDSLHKDRPGLTMDLCGIAKGYALDLLAAHLLGTGAQNFLIDLGGELRAMGLHPSGRAWQVAVEDPRPDADASAAGLRLPSGLSVATSGLRAQSYALGGQSYGHIINPHRAQPAQGTPASVSVMDASAMQADGWATALMAAGDAGPELARAQGLMALFLVQTNGRLHAQTTGGFDRHLI
jgi:thiamine biosynthesis lipoprotein